MMIDGLREEPDGNRWTPSGRASTRRRRAPMEPRPRYPKIDGLGERRDDDK